MNGFEATENRFASCGTSFSAILASLCSALLLLSSLSACARLDIGVDVYKGDLLMPDDSKLAKAVGVARQSYEYTLGYVRKRQPADATVESYLGRVVEVYEEEKIDSLW